MIVKKCSLILDLKFKLVFGLEISTTKLNWALKLGKKIKVGLKKRGMWMQSIKNRINENI